MWSTGIIKPAMCKVIQLHEKKVMWSTGIIKPAMC